MVTKEYKNLLKAFEYRIYPNKTQQNQIQSHFGSCRWIYNYGLNKKIKAYKQDHKTISRFDIQADLPKLKRLPETEWLKSINSQALQAELQNLERAYTSFFRRGYGFPKFKSKHHSKKSFSIPQHLKVDFETGKIMLPKIGHIKTKFHRPFAGTVKTATIKQSSTKKYFVSILVETGIEPKMKRRPVPSSTIGIDLGIKSYMTLSTGEKIKNSKTLNKYQSKLVRTQRRFSKKVKGSANRTKAKLVLSKVHERISNIRKDFLHKLSYRLTNENQVSCIVMEDLNVSGMMKNRKLARSIGDCSWSEFVRQLEYKSNWNGINLIKIGRFEPSSKTCSVCGNVNRNLTLRDRTWTCSRCLVVHDRDINAAINIKHFGTGFKTNQTIPVERRDFKPVENQTATSTRLRVVASHSSVKQEAIAFRQ